MVNPQELPVDSDMLSTGPIFHKQQAELDKLAR
jgi:hypothetical protein